MKKPVDYVKHPNTDGRDLWWSPEAALAFIRRTEVAKTAAREGWIGPLVGFVREEKRAPAWNEISRLQMIQHEFEDALAKTATAEEKSPVRLWKPLGEAMARQQSTWAAAVLA